MTYWALGNVTSFPIFDSLLNIRMSLERTLFTVCKCVSLLWPYQNNLSRCFRSLNIGKWSLLTVLITSDWFSYSVVEYVKLWPIELADVSVTRVCLYTRGMKDFHFVKSVSFQSFSGPNFLAFELNKDQKKSEYVYFSRSALKIKIN